MNYILEGDGNFNIQLMSALCNEEANNEEKMCLISNKLLEKNHITLNCNHKFNYPPLFKEITRQKKNPNRLETQKLKKFQIKCPYCRNVQNTILPYRHSELRVFAVNWPPKYAMLPHKCKATFKTGKRKGLRCNKPSQNEYCNIHGGITNTNLPINILNTSQNCIAILKSGKNKGKKCPCKAKFSGFCGRHKS